MAKMKINQATAKRLLLEETMKRVYSNENGVKSFLSQAGVDVPEGKSVTVLDLQSLHELNPEAFNNMIVFLYPDLFGGISNADGKKGKEGVSEEGEEAAKAGLSDTDKAGIFNLFGGLITTAGGVLTGIYGKDTTGVQTAAYFAQQEAARTQRTLIIVGIIAAVLLIAGVIVLVKRPSNAPHITKV